MTSVAIAQIEIEVTGMQEFSGKEIPVIEGGFGEGEKVVLAKTIAEIHEVELRVINQLINENIEEFEEDVDIIDLKNSISSNDLLLELGFTKQSIANSRNIYLLSEQGYMALIGLMRTDKAKQLRKQFRREYFAMRKQSKLPRSYKEALQQLIYQEEEKEKLQLENKYKDEVIQKQAPKVIFADAVSASHTSILVGDLAKILKQNGIDTGQNRLFDWMRDNGFLIRRKGADYNMPTQKSMEMGLFEIKEGTRVHADGHISITKTTKVTGKGQIYFVNKLKPASQLALQQEVV